MTATSPNGQIEIGVVVVDGTVTYSVNHGGRQVVAPSILGFTSGLGDFVSGVELVAFGEPTTIDDSFSLPHGKARTSSTSGTERTVQLRSHDGHDFAVVVRAYDDGVAFRYRAEFAEPTEIENEATQFAMGTVGRAFLSAYQTATDFSPAYERPYNVIPARRGAPVPGWVFPALFEANGTWLLLTESAVDESYAASHLGPNPTDGTYELDGPLVNEGLSQGSWLPAVAGTWASPWRVIIIGDSPAPIFESNLVRHLGGATEIEDTSWVIPGRVSWSWWSDHLSPQNPAALKDHIDLAAEMGWEYSLIDANWNLMPEGTIEELVAYGSERGVGLFLWYNSGGPHNAVREQPRDRMHAEAVRRAEFEWLASIGVKGIKVDFFHRDNQEGMELYLGILRDAADSRIMINLHGSTIPRGWDRRFPHLMTMEGVWGAEIYSFDGSYPTVAPPHNTILALTRNVPGSMDYTPVTFSDQTFPHVTTNGHELALSVVFESSLQHFADSAASYRAQPEAVRDFLSAVPSVWDESRFLAGEPGDHVVVARRLGDRWWVGGINGSPQARTVQLPMDLFDGPAVLIGDGDDPRSFSIQTVADVGEVTMAPFGGFVVTAAG